ncbi:MAG: hypothetical protein KJ906_01550 [Nanoarchaeota archaeon]|nr:hypothetical protein [Nanoarchaeota archaeon]
MPTTKSLDQHLETIKNIQIKNKNYSEALHRLCKIRRKFQKQNNLDKELNKIKKIREKIKNLRYNERIKNEKISFFRECPNSIRKDISLTAKKIRRDGYSFGEIDKLIFRKYKVKFTSHLWKNVKYVKMTESGLKRYQKKIYNNRIKASSISGKINRDSGHLKKMRKVALEACVKKARERIPQSSKEMTKEKVRILGHCLFDGGLSYKKKGYNAIFYSNNSNKLINQFKNDMKSVYGLKPTDIREREDGNKQIRYCCIAAVEDLYQIIGKTNSKKLPDFIFSLPKSWKILFLKTFWDDEGCVCYNDFIDSKNRKHINRAVEAFVADDIIRAKLNKLHNDIGIETRIWREKIIVSRIENLRKFSKLINFSSGIRVSYPKSKWDGMEKRRVLEMALGTMRVS